jgi:hypothetical protein
MRPFYQARDKDRQYHVPARVRTPMVQARTSERSNRPSRLIVVALIGFQGRGFTDAYNPIFVTLSSLKPFNGLK